MKSIILNKIYTIIDFTFLKYRLPAFLGLLFLLLMPSNGFDISACIFNSVLDIPCPACGLTRSMSSLLKFNILQGFTFHPLGFIALIYLIVTLITNQPNYIKSKFNNNFKAITIVFSFRFIVFLFLITWFIKLNTEFKIF